MESNIRNSKDIKYEDLPETVEERIVFLNQSSYLLENSFRLLGCTLWSNVPTEHYDTIAEIMNDYSTIKINRDWPNGFCRELTVSDTVQLHKESVSWLKSEIEKAKSKGEIVTVLTHHAPSFLGLNPTLPSSPIKYAYCTDLEYLMGDNVHAWYVKKSFVFVNNKVFWTYALSVVYSS
jgi:hypothetical protein